MKTDYKKKLLSFYDIFPFQNHPLWQGVLKHELSLKEIIEAEKQHYIRTKAGQLLRAKSAQFANNKSPKIYEAALENYLEEVAPNGEHQNHLELIKRLLTEAGVTETQLKRIKSTAGNAAAMALYKDIADRGTACHLIGAGMVEYFYSELSPKIFAAYTSFYKMTEHQAETYKLHGTMDKDHAQRAFDVIEEAISLNGWQIIENSVRDAFAATSLHYDGMLQAALKKIIYWNGEVR